MTAASTARPERTGLPLILVECTGCGLRFNSAARSHTNCPRCRRNLRVHRSPRVRVPRGGLAIVPASARPAGRPPIPAAPVRQPVAFPGIRPAPVRQAPAPAAQPAAPGGGQEMTFAAAAAVLGWRLAPDPGDICQIITDEQRCPGEIRHHVDGRRPRDMVWICSRHNDELGKLINGRLNR